MGVALMPIDKLNDNFQGEARLTSGLEILPILGEKLETTKLTTSFTVNGSGSGLKDLLIVMRCESLTKNFLKNNNKVYIGLQVSQMPDSILKLTGPFTFGAKIDKYASLSIRGSITMSRRDRNTSLTMEHRRYLSSGTTLNTKVSCENLRKGSISLKILSFDHPEIAFGKVKTLHTEYFL